MGKEVPICVADSSCGRRKAYVWIDRYKMQDQDEECGQCGRVARAAWFPRHHLRAGRADLGEFWATCGPRRQRTAVAGLLRSNVAGGSTHLSKSAHYEWLVLNIRPAWFLLQARPNLVLISSAPNGWADVFAPEDGQYDHYGYNVTQDRWAYNIQPRDAVERMGLRKQHSPTASFREPLSVFLDVRPRLPTRNPPA